MEIQILKWFLLANLGLGTLIRIGMIGRTIEYTKAGAAIGLLLNGAMAGWVYHALS